MLKPVSLEGCVTGVRHGVSPHACLIATAPLRHCSFHSYIHAICNVVLCLGLFPRRDVSLVYTRHGPHTFSNLDIEYSAAVVYARSLFRSNLISFVEVCSGFNIAFIL